MLPFTPRRKDNLAAWLVARSDGEHYGNLRVFQFPKQKVVFGPRQVVARINQDQMISPQITLWNQQGSQVTWGTLMVIPIEESLIYVRPLYLRGAGGRIPELTRVIVAYQDQIVMEETLEAALARLFGGSGRPAAQPSGHRDRRRRSSRGATSAQAAAPGSRCDRRSCPLSPRKRRRTTSAPSTRSAPATGRKYGEEIEALGRGARQDEADKIPSPNARSKSQWALVSALRSLARRAAPRRRSMPARCSRAACTAARRRRSR